MLRNNQMVAAELEELRDVAESAARRAELLLNWVSDQGRSSKHIEEARVKLRQAYQEIQSARLAVEREP